MFPDAHITLAHAKDFLVMVKHLTNRGLHSAVIDLTEIGRLDKDAREYLVKALNAWGKLRQSLL